MAILETDVDFSIALDARRGGRRGGRPRAIDRADATVMQSHPGKWFVVASKAKGVNLTTRVGQLRRKLPKLYGGSWEVCSLDEKLAARFVSEGAVIQLEVTREAA